MTPILTCGIGLSMSHRGKIVLIIVLAIVLAGSGCGSSNTRHLTGIQVYPLQPNAAAGTQLQFSITAFYSDRTLQTLANSQGKWSSSNDSIVTVDENGLATSLGPQGFTAISVTANGHTSTTTLSVGP